MSWFTRKDKPDGRSWKPDSDSLDTQKTPLAPFHSDAQGSLYNSNMIRDWTKLGYSYPELQPWLPEYRPFGVFDRHRYLRAIKRQINKLYGSTRRLVLGSPWSKIEGLGNDYIVNVIYERQVVGRCILQLLMGVQICDERSTFHNSCPYRT